MVLCIIGCPFAVQQLDEVAFLCSFAAFSDEAFAKLHGHAICHGGGMSL
tara:strand:- start:168 stop:314 length:147 start_codon:yes stop_codon:yes gene_type:complete